MSELNFYFPDKNKQQVNVKYLGKRKKRFGRRKKMINILCAACIVLIAGSAAVKLAKDNIKTDTLSEEHKFADLKKTIEDSQRIGGMSLQDIKNLAHTVVKDHYLDFDEATNYVYEEMHFGAIAEVLNDFYTPLDSFKNGYNTEINEDLQFIERNDQNIEMIESKANPVLKSTEEVENMINSEKEKAEIYFEGLDYDQIKEIELHVKASDYYQKELENESSHRRY